MRFIDLDDFNPDPNWVVRADSVTNQLLAAANINDVHQIIDSNEALWGELKDALLSLSHDKCWYSEAKDKYSYLHVDHFRPKKAAFGIDKVDYGCSIRNSSK